MFAPLFKIRNSTPKLSYQFKLNTHIYVIERILKHSENVRYSIHRYMQGRIGSFFGRGNYLKGQLKCKKNN